MLAACAAALAVSGCGSTILSPSGTHAAPGPAASSSGPRSYVVTAPVSTVIVNGGAGTVTVTGTSAATVTVTEQAYYSDSAKPPATSHVDHDGTLTLGYSCPLQLTCGVSYVVGVPRRATVQVSDREGAIILASLAGPLRAQTLTGVITATGLASPTATFKSTAGEISAAFSAVPASVSASTTAGPITLKLPPAAAYQVHSHTYVGSSTVTVRQSATASSVITASSDVGSITVGPA
jgi:subtilisin family serine protease